MALLYGKQYDLNRLKVSCKKNISQNAIFIVGDNNEIANKVPTTNSIKNIFYYIVIVLVPKKKINDWYRA